MSRDLMKIAKEREIVNNTIRSFFRDRGYVEVETPIVVRSPGMEPNLVPFETRVMEPDGTKHAAGLITSPEYSMKKLMGAGMEKIFTITKVFRNEEAFGGNHNPEFSMLEWYQQGADYQACMDETEALVRTVVSSPPFEGGAKGWLEPFRRVRIVDLFAQAGLDLDHLEHIGDDTDSDAFHRAFLNGVEPVIASEAWQSPVFLYDYPTYQASLSRLTSDKKFGERFELYINGLELCNGFTELTDATEQRRRFIEEAEERRSLGKTVFPLDEEFLRLLPNIKTPSFGNALGIDRLHMIATRAKSIEEVLLFPAATLFKQ